MSLVLDQLVTPENFDERTYLASNSDVAAAVKRGHIESGRKHFEIFGAKEKRRQRIGGEALAVAKAKKHARIQPLLRTDMPCIATAGAFDFLTPELRRRFAIVDTDAVSAHDYDEHGSRLIEKHRERLVLDCGAGRRSVYFDNVVNFEIVDYDTTDVRGVGEVLPFLDNSFDAVLSVAVLEHVKDPFTCARELV